MVTPQAGVDQFAHDWRDGLMGGVLLVQHCTRCLRVQLPPTACCRTCFSQELTLRAADGHGHLEAATLLHSSPYPDRADLLPLWIVHVRLMEGVLLFANLASAGNRDVTGPRSRSELPECLTWSGAESARRGSPVFTPAAACAARAREAS